MKLIPNPPINFRLSWDDVTQLFTREALILLVYMAISACVLNIFMQTRALEEGSAQFGFAKMLDGTAELPYVKRQLVPIIANHLANLIPTKDQAAFVQYHLDKYHLKQIYFGKAKYQNKGMENWSADYAIKYHITYIILFISLMGTLYLLRALTHKLIVNENYLAPFIPILFLLLLPLSFLHGNFYYVFVELFFLSALLLAAAYGRFFWWLILLPIAVFNKESNILVPLLYAIFIFTHCKHWGTRITVLTSIALSAMVYSSIKLKFEQNAGGTVIWQLGQNIEFWLNPKNYFLWHDFYAPLIPFPRGLNFLFLMVLFSLIFKNWKTKPMNLKALLATAVAINIPLVLFFCHMDEMRNLSFLFIPIHLLIAHTLLTTSAKGETK